MRDGDNNITVLQLTDCIFDFLSYAAPSCASLCNAAYGTLH